MRRPNFFNDQLVLAEDLNYIIDAVTVEVARRLQAGTGMSGGYNEAALTTYKRYQAGIFGSPGESTTFANLKVSNSGDSSITVYPGSALTSDGNLIYVSSSITLNRGYSTSTYSWLGSSGINYVKIKYQESSGSIKTDDYGVPYPTRFDSGYFINIDNNPPTGNELLLARFTGDSQGKIIGNIEDCRLYVRRYTFADAVGLDPFNTPVSSHKNVGDHIRATGSATPTPNNPHGLSFADIGGSLDLLSVKHATDLHINAIIPYSTQISTFDSYKGNIVNQYSGAYITFNPPTNAILVVNGNVITGSLPPLYASDAYSINGDGMYFAVVDSQGQTSWKPFVSFQYDSLFTQQIENVRYSTGHLNKEYYILGVANIADNGDDITSWIDSRLFRGTHPIDIAADPYETYYNPNAYPLQYRHSLVDTLARIRWQLGMAINGTGSNWKSSVFPLTAGPTSDADPYHTHNSLKQLKSEIFVLKNQRELVPNLYEIATGYENCEQFMNISKILEWENLTSKGLAQVSTIPGSGNVLITLNEIGLYEIEALLFVVNSGSITDTSSYYMASVASRFNKEGTPTWNYLTHEYDYIDHQNTARNLRIGGLKYVGNVDGVYNNFVVFTNWYKTTGGGDVYIEKNTWDRNNSNFLGGIVTYLKVTKVQDILGTQEQSAL